MVTRIEVITNVFDTRAAVKEKNLQSLQLIPKESHISLIDVYTLTHPFSSKELKQIAEMIANPVTQSYNITTDTNKSPLQITFSHALEIGFLPGVTDNIGATAKEEIEDLMKIKFALDENVYFSSLILIEGDTTDQKIKNTSQSLTNPLINRVQRKSYKQFNIDKGMDFIVPSVDITSSGNVEEVDLNISDKELIDIGKLGILGHDGIRRGPLALDLPYMKTIQRYFKKQKRNPFDIELESIAQTWSEHCKHTIFADPLDEFSKGLYKSHIKHATEVIRKKMGKKDICVSVFTDNSGAIEFDAKYLVTHKAETHNSPSALDPFGGAVTGIVGVNRDAMGFGMGAKPIINTYGFCFASPFSKTVLYKDKGKTHQMLSPRRILDGVVSGVNNGGNCSGIPCPQGFVYFNDRYQGKPLVFVGTVGVIPKKVNGKKSYIKKALPNDYIVMVGGRVGADGIHGATFSSVALDSGSPATAVQIGDPITQKKFSDAIIKEARDMGLFNSITDNGAGGLSCSVAEMAKESGGCSVLLDKVPLKYPGLEPWQIWISESQERMTLAVPKEKWKKFESLMKRRGVEATIIGTFTNSGKCIVTFNRKTIMDLDMEFLHDGLPKKQLKTREVKKKLSEPKINIADMNKEMLTLVSSLNSSSYEFITQQYDHIVQGGTSLYPLQGKGRVNSDATIVRPVLASQKGVVLSQALYPLYSDINTYHMASCSIDTAVRNVIVAGANPEKIALLDNFCWCSSNNPERLYELKQATQACFDTATAYKTPFISGKDSMFNDFNGYDEKANPVSISIPPTLLISSIGIIEDVNRAVSLDMKFVGDLIYLLGDTENELGGSEFYHLKGQIGKHVPQVNTKKNLNLYSAYYSCVQNDLISSGISVHRGGLALALLRSSMGGKLGVSISLEEISKIVKKDYELLFSESQGRILVTINPKNKTKFERLMKGVTITPLGLVTDSDVIEIKGKEKKSEVKLSLHKAITAYRNTFKGF